MKTTESFTRQIENTFEELEKFSEIRIDCKKLEKAEIAIEGPTIKVVAVNGMKTARKFEDRMQYLVNEALDKFEGMVTQAPPEYQDIIVDLAIERVQEMAEKVILIRKRDFEEQIIESACWVSEVFYYVGDDQSDDYGIIAEAATLSRKFAWSYFAEINKLDVYISSFGSIPLGDFCFGQDEDEKDCVPFRKIELLWSVPVFCALIRILIENNKFEKMTFNEASLWVSENFCTIPGDELDPKDILYLIENPSQESLDELRLELLECEKYLAEMLQEQAQQAKSA